MRPESALLVTGAYYPEISASGIQCREVARILGGRVRFGVLTTAFDRTLPPVECVDGVDVFRVAVDGRRRASKLTAAPRLFSHLLAVARRYDVVHLHGFSQKNVPVTLAARLARRRIVLTLHTAGQDEPNPVRQRGRLAYRSFMAADLLLPVSPLLRDRCVQAGIPPDRVRVVPNGVDISRFRPVHPTERIRIRRDLGLPCDRPVVLFVGFFSRDKRPDVVVRAWRRLREEHRLDTRLVFAGATAPTYFEIDRSLVEAIQREVAETAVADRVHFVEPTNEIARYIQAADVFALPSAREAHPVALLEAMACGLPVVASRLPGATDVIVEDGVNGRLVPVNDEAAFAAALRDVLIDNAGAARMGERARDTIARRFDIRKTAEGWFEAYQETVDAGGA